jgi:hypothetical protein
VEKAASLMKTLESSLTETNIPSRNIEKEAPITGDSKNEKQDTPKIEIQHFTQKEGTPWGFEAVAGMDELKEELRSSFIKPLRFKFMIERLRRET